MVHKPTTKVVKRNLLAWALLAPTLIFLITFTFYPFVKTIVLSFFEKNLYVRQEQFVGFQNYTTAFKDSIFLTSILNNVKFSLLVVPSSLVLGLVFAYLLNSGVKGLTFFRTALFYPNVSPMIGFSLIWMFLLTPNIGFFDNLIRRLGGTSVNWLGDPAYVLYALAFVYIWREAGYMMIFFLSGMQSISTEYYEAALIDGASEFKKFFKITLPLLMPTIVFAVTLTITNSIKMVDSIIVMTKGGPNNASSMIMYYIYQTAFSFWDQGLAATFSVIMLVAVLLVVALQYFGLDKLTHYES